MTVTLRLSHNGQLVVLERVWAIHQYDRLVQFDGDLQSVYDTLDIDHAEVSFR